MRENMGQKNSVFAHFSRSDCCKAPSYKAFIKPFEALQRRVKIKIWVNFLPSSGIGTGTIKIAIEV